MIVGRIHTVHGLSRQAILSPHSPTALGSTLAGMQGAAASAQKVHAAGPDAATTIQLVHHDSVSRRSTTTCNEADRCVIEAACASTCPLAKGWPSLDTREISLDC